MILFRHAQIYDGTGPKPFLGDVLVRNDRRIKAKLKGLPPAIHRQQALSAA